MAVTLTQPDGEEAGPLSVTSATTIWSRDVTGYGSIGVQIVSAGTTCTISYEVSQDNTTWVATTGVLYGAPSTMVRTTTAAGMVVFPKHFRYWRARVSTYTSGTVTIWVCLNREPFTWPPVVLA